VEITETVKYMRYNNWHHRCWLHRGSGKMPL